MLLLRHDKVEQIAEEWQWWRPVNLSSRPIAAFILEI